MYWGIIIFSIVIFLILSSLVLPRLLLQIGYKDIELSDQGSKVFLKNGNKCFLFNTNNTVKEYINQYILTNEQKQKTLICRYSEDVQEMGFDVACYNEKGKIFKVVSVFESSIENATSRTITLPYKTSYITLIAKRVNGKNLIGPKKRYLPRSIHLFLLCETIALFITVFAVRYCLSILYGDVFYYDLMHNIEALSSFIGVLLGIFIVNVIIVEVYFNFKKVK